MFDSFGFEFVEQFYRKIVILDINFESHFFVYINNRKILYLHHMPNLCRFAPSNQLVYGHDSFRIRPSRKLYQPIGQIRWRIVLGRYDRPRSTAGVRRPARQCLRSSGTSCREKRRVVIEHRWRIWLYLFTWQHWQPIINVQLAFTL